MVVATTYIAVPKKSDKKSRKKRVHDRKLIALYGLYQVHRGAAALWECSCV